MEPSTPDQALLLEAARQFIAQSAQLEAFGLVANLIGVLVIAGFVLAAFIYRHEWFGGLETELTRAGNFEGYCRYRLAGLVRLSVLVLGISLPLLASTAIGLVETPHALGYAVAVFELISIAGSFAVLGGVHIELARGGDTKKPSRFLRQSKKRFEQLRAIHIATGSYANGGATT